ncbi:RNA polymerase sigma factor YlaC [compost metagenome]
MKERNDVIEDYFRKEYRTLCKRVYRRAGTMENAEDVVQEAFARALKYYPAFDNSGKEFGAWFSTILNNSLNSFTRAEMNYGMCEELDEDHIEGEPMSEVEENMLAKVNELIDKKPPHIAEMLRLYFLNGYKPKEIAEILEVKDINIRMTVMRFKEDMREQLGRSGDRI